MLKTPVGKPQVGDRIRVNLPGDRTHGMLGEVIVISRGKLVWEYDCKLDNEPHLKTYYANGDLVPVPASPAAKAPAEPKPVPASTPSANGTAKPAPAPTTHPHQNRLDAIRKHLASIVRELEARMSVRTGNLLADLLVLEQAAASACDQLWAERWEVVELGKDAAAAAVGG